MNKARIIENNTNHGFEIGAIVEVKETDVEGEYEGRVGKVMWFLESNEIELQ